MNKTEMESSTSGNCSSVSTTGLTNSGSESDLRQRELIDERMLKRKQSNRESAKRSRMKKQKHLHELAAQVSHLRNENSQIIAGITVRTQHYVAIEAENSILRAQLQELQHRLESLNEIIESSTGGFGMETGQGGGVLDCCGFGGDGFYDGVMNPLNLGFYNQPNIASVTTGAAGDVFNC